MTTRTAHKLTPAQRTALDTAEGRRITCAPSTARALHAMRIAGPVVRRVTLQEQAPHGKWFNRQFVQCEFLQGPRRSNGGF